MTMHITPESAVSANGLGHSIKRSHQPTRRASWKGKAAWVSALAAVTLATAGAGIAYDLPSLALAASGSAQHRSEQAEDGGDHARALANSTLLALHHANMTDNYTVLHQLSAPAFQAVNSAQRLSLIFKETRRRQLDLSVAAHTQPQWIAPPAVAANGQLHMKGFYPAAGGRLYFDLVYASHEGKWRLLGISVSMQPGSA